MSRIYSLRFPIALALAFVVNGAVFWFLWTMINVKVHHGELRSAAKIEFTRMRRDTEVATIKRDKPQREKIVQQPTTPQVARASFARGGTESVAHLLAPPTIDAKAGLSMGVNISGSDRDVMPLVQIHPDYPPRAQSRGIEGWVVVQFTITPAGTVRDATVVEAQPKGMFDDAAIKAVSRWKYNPKVEEGVPVERRGVQVKLTFKLEA
ncbi:MAG: energy transducer TonB [Candidatus Binatia bacterium]